MDKLSRWTPIPQSRHSLSYRFILLTLFLAFSSLSFLASTSRLWHREATTIPINAVEIMQKCQYIQAKPGPPPDFYDRTVSDRFEHGTIPTLIKNATIWTGRASGREVITGDILVDGGLLKEIGSIQQDVLDSYSTIITLDAGGAWVTPGIVDMHSHVGVLSIPALRGSNDGNSFNGLVLPWLRSLDGLNTHDDAFRLSISGGVTTALVLPGSADAIGGQAFVIKLRPTSERSSSSMLLEPPYTLNGSIADPSLPPRWRQMKHACGENPSRIYKGTRMDNVWAFRQGYETARKIKEEALSGNWNGLQSFPEDLQWEALVDVLRGHVKVHNHCYEAVDLDGMVRLTNEFKFSIAAFHHAHEAYLVPDLLKKAYGESPAIAMFATNARYKREAYRGSPFAPRILADSGLSVVMKSDHPVLDSRFLLFEAQQAHYYGLVENLAIASLTSTPATIIGQDHRVGFIKPGYDADLVIWDRHPLALGATPMQVYIDGVAQLKNPFQREKQAHLQHAPQTPNFNQEVQETLAFDGLPPLGPNRTAQDMVVFENVGSLFMRSGDEINRVVHTTDQAETVSVVMKDGVVICAGVANACESYRSGAVIVDLEGGTIAPALTTFGSPLGLEAIPSETSTKDGDVYDPLSNDEGPHAVLGGDGSVIRAVDGLSFATRDALLAYRSGVTAAVVPPSSHGFLAGLSTVFGTGQPHALAEGAVIQDVAALHVAISEDKIASISTQIAALRNLLLGGGKGNLREAFADVVKGKIPLVIAVYSADIMASLIRLKSEIEEVNFTSIVMTFVGAKEAHILAKEIGKANIGVILQPARPKPFSWKSRRILAGPPLTKDTSVSLLRAHGVTVGIGVDEAWSAVNTRFDIAWAGLDVQGEMSETEIYALASVNLEKLLGIRKPNGDLVAVRGGSMLGFEGKVVGVVSAVRGVVDLF